MESYEPGGPIGGMTLFEVRRIITENIRKAEKLGLVLHIEFLDGRVRGRVFRGGTTIHERWYQGDFLPILIVRMHNEWARFLQMESFEPKVLPLKKREG